MATKELFYFTLPAPDIEKSKVFFSNVLGWKVGGGSMGGNIGNTTTACGLSSGNNVHEIMVYFTTFDMAPSLERVQQCGGKILKDEQFSVGRSVFCQDNQGTHFALHEPSQETLEHAQHPKKGSKTGDLFFFSLPIKEETKGKDFYSAVMNWEFGNKGEQGGNGILNLEGPDGGLGSGRNGQYASLWFRVADIQQVVSKVKEAGGKAGEIFQAPEGTMSECVDNQGVQFGIVQPADGY